MASTLFSTKKDNYVINLAEAVTVNDINGAEHILPLKLTQADIHKSMSVMTGTDYDEKIKYLIEEFFKIDNTIELEDYGDLIDVYMEVVQYIGKQEAVKQKQPYKKY